jgi:NADPH:quinone reductase
MRAIVVDRLMEPAELRVADAPEPALVAGGLLVDVAAAGCNFFDILMAQGRYQVRPPLPFVPGAELAGVVRAVGPEVDGFRAGDRVLASVSTGAFAERALVAARSAWRMPDGMTFEEGAAFPIVYPTSYAALVLRAQLRAGETLLVHAAAGGVGLAAVQIGKALGARVLATAGGEEKLAVARDAGADVCIDYRAEDWPEQVKAATGGRGADVIYDSVGGDVLDRSLTCIAWSGRLLVIGFAGGTIPAIKANRILLKNIAVIGLHWGAYAIHEPARVGEVFTALFRMYETGTIRPEIGGRYPLERAADALVALGSRRTHGKIVLTPSPRT